jgi:integrase
VSQRGSVRKRGDTWTAYWFVTDAAGDRHQRSKGGFRLKAHAQEYLNGVLGRLGDGSYIEPNKLTVADFLNDHWLPAIATTVRPTTLLSYRQHVSDYLDPHIGALPLLRLSGDRLNALYATLLANGSKKGRGGLSPATVRRTHNMLHRALKDAVRWNRLAINPADAADPPKLTASKRKPMKTWTAGEVQAFLAHVAGDRLYAAWALAASTGMRRGEVLGLRWCDVDLDAGRVSIRQTLVTVGYRVEYGTPKTDRGRRQIPLDTRTVAILRSHRARQAQERLAWGPAYDDADLVFAREDGRWVHPDTFCQHFEKHVRNASLPRIRLHDLRHTYASLSLQAGVSVKVVSERLGHASAAFTQDVYMHALPGMQEDAAELVAALVFGA